MNYFQAANGRLMKNNNYNIWWGPPRKFSTKSDERKISWLELFYDLVYVIVISRITKHLADKPGIEGILNYVYLFAMIFWGWLNGSEYHDLHGSPGIRTRFMTLWQMMAVAALGVALDSPQDVFITRTTICFAFLQGFITYLWWSVGIYDKNHRKLSVPYVACYLASFVLLIISLFAPSSSLPIFFLSILVINFLPPFLNSRRLRSHNSDFSLSMSMVERLGLFTIIVFGENILGIINGTGSVAAPTSVTWSCFALGILIVFALWWIFFALVADRECRHGFLVGQLFAFMFIPTLSSLGIIGATCAVLFANTGEIDSHLQTVRNIFGSGMSLFLLSVLSITRLLIYPADYGRARKVLEPLIFISALAIIAITVFFSGLPLVFLLLIIFILLLVIIVVITRIWFAVQLRYIAEGSEEE
jgi:low temperature requirement protein LtrA